MGRLLDLNNINVKKPIVQEEVPESLLMIAVTAHVSNQATAPRVGRVLGRVKSQSPTANLLGSLGS
jgi:hypothetical protein